MKILGLDISTAIIGWTILKDGELVDIGHIDLRKLPRNIWVKAKYAKTELEAMCLGRDIDHLVIEDPVAKFTKGKSSAHTIMLLASFNALCSWFMIEGTGITPTYIAANHARTVLGLDIKKNNKKLRKQGIVYPDSKLQTFELLRNVGPFEGKVWPVKPRSKVGNLQDYCYDEMDSYVVARAGYLELKEKEDGEVSNMAGTD